MAQSGKDQGALGPNPFDSAPGMPGGLGGNLGNMLGGQGMGGGMPGLSGLGGGSKRGVTKKVNKRKKKK
jgi:hypothetical protein